MDDSQLDGLLRGLAEQPVAAGAGPGFHDGVWSRIGRMSEARDQRRRTVLGLAIFVVALGAGVGATRSPAHAEQRGLMLADGSDLSPAALLHATP